MRIKSEALKSTVLYQWQMNPVSLKLRLGDEINIVGNDESGNKSKRKVTVKKFYQSHVLCTYRGRNECFTYNEISQQEEIRERVLNDY